MIPQNNSSFQSYHSRWRLSLMMTPSFNPLLAASNVLSSSSPILSLCPWIVFQIVVLAQTAEPRSSILTEWRTNIQHLAPGVCKSSSWQTSHCTVNSNSSIDIKVRHKSDTHCDGYLRMGMNELNEEEANIKSLTAILHSCGVRSLPSWRIDGRPDWSKKRAWEKWCHCEESLRKVMSSSVNVAIVCVITGQFHGSHFLVFGGGKLSLCLCLALEQPSGKDSRQWRHSFLDYFWLHILSWEIAFFHGSSSEGCSS